MSVVNNVLKDFPCGSVVKNLPPSARDMASIPDPGRSHMPKSNWVCVHHSYWACAPQPLSPHTLEPMHCMKSSPDSSHLEKSPHSTEDPAWQKKTTIYLKDLASLEGRFSTVGIYHCQSHPFLSYRRLNEKVLWGWGREKSSLERQFPGETTM